MKTLFSFLAVIALCISAQAQLILKAGADGTVYEPSPVRMTSPVLSGTITGTYTLGGTSSIAVGGITGLGTGVATFLATPSSANLASAVTGETGSGAAVFGTAPTLSAAVVTPALTSYASDGAITIASGIAQLTKAGVGAYTIAAPSAQDGTRITIISNSDNAHVVTFTGGTLLDGTTGANTTATFAAFKGAAITVIASGATWLTESINAVTPAP